MSEANSGRGAWGKILLLALFVCLILGGMGGYVWWRHEKWRWEKIPMRDSVAQVTKTWTLAELAERLHDKGRVREKGAFLEAAKELKIRSVAPGGYLLPKEAGPRDLALLFSGPPQLVKITFPEGWTAGQMAKRLAANQFGGAQSFVALAYPAGAQLSPLEGKLFPDTYFLSKQASGQDLARQLHKRFQEVATNLSKPYPTGAGGKRLTMDEVTILASLVEREAKLPDERPLIAGVLLNRLRIGMRLQCDATVQYARRRAVESGTLPENEAGDDGQKTRLLFRDLVIASPYNTYQHAGLPPGPICNPGEDSLKAAVHPEKSDYLFYVMSPKLGRHRFAKTFAEHQHNIALAKLEK